MSNSKNKEKQGEKKKTIEPGSLLDYVGAIFIIVLFFGGILIVWNTTRPQKQEYPYCIEEQSYSTSWSSVSGDVVWKKIIKVDCPDNLKIYDK